MIPCPSQPMGATGRSGQLIYFGRRQKRKLCPLAETTMSSPSLPPELLDHVVDLLHHTEDAPETAPSSPNHGSRVPENAFSPISSSGPRTTSSFKSWKETFPDALTSPAYHVHTSTAKRVRDVTVADAEQGSWITGFADVVRFKVTVQASQGLFTDHGRSALVPFRGFSPVMKSVALTSFHPREFSSSYLAR